jgi:hypothetical protein
METCGYSSRKQSRIFFQSTVKDIIKEIKKYVCVFYKQNIASSEIFVAFIISFKKGNTLLQMKVYFLTPFCQDTSRGLQCFKLNGNQTENDRYWQKITFYFLQNV